MQGTVRHSCRLCGGKLNRVFSLLPTPIANDYPKEPDGRAKQHPLELMQCKDCGHVQQSLVFDCLFQDYKYRTPTASHWEPLAKDISARYRGGRVLEIGCNNGLLLDLLENVEAVGVDPSSEHPKALQTYFGAGIAEYLGKFDVILAMNVLAHIDNLDDVFEGINAVLKIDGELIFEVQYLVDLLKNGGFDMVYHEHCDYHHLKPLRKFLRKHGLVMVKWVHLPEHGGSIRVHARRYGTECEIPAEPLDWSGFDRKLSILRLRLHEEIDKRGGKIQAYGAPAKATTFIRQMGLKDKITKVIDDTPQKQGRYVPGTDIQIRSAKDLDAGPVLLLSWNYADIICKKISNEVVNPCALVS